MSCYVFISTVLVQDRDCESQQGGRERTVMNCHVVWIGKVAAGHRLALWFCREFVAALCERRTVAVRIMGSGTATGGHRPPLQMPRRGCVIQPGVGGPSRTGEERLRWVGVKKKSQPQRGCSGEIGDEIKPIQG